MKNIDNDDLKKIELDLLSRIHHFCNNNHLRYFLCGGTLLGAVRHKGFIPWDDDIDIQMPRPDYDFFIEHFVSDDNISILSPRTQGYYYNFSKAVNPKTKLLLGNCQKIEGYGVFVDIFPLDGMPEDGAERMHHFKELDKIRAQINSFSIARPTPRRNLYEYFRLYYYYLINKKRNMTVFQNKYNQLAHKFSYDDSKYVYLTGGAYRVKEIYEKEIYSNTELVEFEGCLFCAPKQWDKYLSQTYGDYMMLPPVEKRVTNHNFRAVYL